MRNDAIERSDVTLDKCRGAAAARRRTYLDAEPALDVKVLAYLADALRDRAANLRVQPFLLLFGQPTIYHIARGR